MKKFLIHPKANEDPRQSFQENIHTYQNDGRPIVYLDESRFATDMPRTHGYSKQSQRCFSKQDWHAWGRMNVLGALLAGMPLTVGLTTSNTDADIFNFLRQRDLLPKVPPGALIVLDNAIFHKRSDTKAMIKDTGRSLEYLSPDSPDLNPIESTQAQYPTPLH